MKIERHIDELLEQAAAFVRGGDPTGAVVRARFAREELARHPADLGANDFLAAETRARVDHRIAEYETLLRNWQALNAARHAAYLKRERAAIRADLPVPS